jgi:chromosome segregation protein
MKVTRLEIFGFKSFLERFVLNFDKSMIGIVGPNGCGKSNVVDALRWVLGETHAKQLRGGSFEDLIFNGSESKRPLGMAEVSLTIQPDSDWNTKIKAQSDLSQAISELDKLESEIELHTENQVTENSEGEHELSGDKDTETSSQDAENKSDKEEPLSIVSKRIMEIPGILDVAEIQFTRRLYRSGESEYFINKVPCRLRDLQDVYRLIGLGARGLSIVQQGQIGQFISKKPSERRELLEEAAGISGFRTKMEAATRRLDKTNDNLARATDIITEVEKQVRSLKRQAQRAMARQSLKDELYQAEKELYTIRSSKLVYTLSEKDTSRMSLEQDLQVSTSHIESFEARVLELDAILHDAETAILGLRREKDIHSKALLEQEARIQNIRVELASLETEESYTRKRLKDGSSRMDSAMHEREELVRQIDSLREELETRGAEKCRQSEALENLKSDNTIVLDNFIEHSKASHGADVAAEGSTSAKIMEINSRISEKEVIIQNSDELHRKANSDKAVLRQAEQDKIRLEKNLTRIESEILAIDKQISTYTDHAIEAVGGNASESRILLSAIEVPEKYERAVTAILGERAEFLFSEESQKLLSDYLGSSTRTKKKTGVINCRSNEIATQPEFDYRTVSGVSTFFDVVNCEEAYREPLEHIFVHTYFADSLVAAEALQSGLNRSGISQYTISLPEGEIITPWGWFTTEGESVHLSFMRRKNELLLQSSELEEQIALSKADLQQKELELQKTLDEIDLLNQNRNELNQLQKELSSLLKSLADEERKKAEETRQKERLLREELRASEDQQERVLRQLDQECLQIESSLKNTEHQIQRIDTEIETITQNSEFLEEQLSSISQKILAARESVQSEIATSSSEESIEHKNRISELEQQIEDEENKRLALQKELGDIRYQQSESRRERESIERKLRTVTTEADRSRIELEMLHSEFVKQYPEDDFFVLPEVAQASDFIQQFQGSYDQTISDLAETAQGIRKRLDREGEVDPQSIELYEQEEARLSLMTSQVADLRKAKETLEKTIRQLKELSKIRFVETFKIVSTKFRELVPRLFAGGSGHLELLNPEDPLQSGVNIVVRPPGKKITTMELMSGGEKALVATAVLVAMFLHHPGPICVLDEVDAPLDDANLGRFLSLIREISDKTQFLVITHNKLTMQAVDRLIGITMQESGVTTAISVDLEEAEEEIEKWVATAA